MVADGVAEAAAPGLVVAASARGWCVSGRGGSWDPVARVRSASAGVVVSGRRSVVAGGRHISGRNPCSGLHRSRQRRRPRVPRSFLDASSWRCSSFYPWLWLRRETSDPLDRAMEASSRLSPPWGHRLGAGYDWETGGWRHLRRVGCGIFAAWFAASSPRSLLRQPFRGR